MRLDENNNRKVILRLAKSSVRTSGLRNFFTVAAIVLSVSLLMTMGTYVLGVEKAAQRQVADMQQVIYGQMEEKAAEKMAEESEVSYLLLMKQGMGIEFGNKILLPSYYAENAIKGEKGAVKTVGVEAGGRFPQQTGEAALTREYCRLMGIVPEVGTAFSITGIDGVKEKFVISGILDGDWKSSNIYPVLFSKAYAEEGHLLKDVPYNALVKLWGAEDMEHREFDEKIKMLGEKYGIRPKDINPNNYFTGTLRGDSVRTQERITIVGIGIAILFVSVLVIYSVFYLSVIGRIRQFGQLRTLGMTKKQIRKMVAQEGIILSMIGIPAGLVIGGTIGYALKPDGWDWTQTILIVAVVALADVITVQVSLAKPAALAAEISPIEAARFTGNTERRKRKKHSAGRKAVPEKGRLQRSLTPFGLARISAGQNRRKAFLTMFSLGVGGILYMIASTFIVSVNLEEYSRQSTFAKGEYAITLSDNAAQTSGHGLSGVQADNPLNPVFVERLRAIDGVKEVFIYQRMEMKWEANGETQEDSVVGFDRKLLEKIQSNYVDRDSEVKKLDYDEMVKKGQILIYGNAGMEEFFGWRFRIGDQVKMTFDNGRELLEKVYTVAGFIEDDDYYGEKGIVTWWQMPQTLLDEVSRGLNLNDLMIVRTDEAKEKTITPAIEELAEENPNLILYTLKERRVQDAFEFRLLFAVVLGLSLFIIGFSILNLLNTLITNIVTRKQEFAMLESVGMSRRQLNRMVSMEGLILSAGNAVMTLTAGTAAGYGAVMLLRKFSMKYLHFHFPTGFYLGYVMVLVIVPVVVTAVILRGLEKTALTERLRVED